MLALVESLRIPTVTTEESKFRTSCEFCLLDRPPHKGGLFLCE
jgi:hypothetical protein